MSEKMDGFRKEMLSTMMMMMMMMIALVDPAHQGRL